MGCDREGVGFPDDGELLLAELMIGVYDWSVHQSKELNVHEDSHKLHVSCIVRLWRVEVKYCSYYRHLSGESEGRVGCGAENKVMFNVN